MVVLLIIAWNIKTGFNNVEKHLEEINEELGRE